MAIRGISVGTPILRFFAGIGSAEDRRDAGTQKMPRGA
jgi:hypothetical protein